MSIVITLISLFVTAVMTVGSFLPVDLSSVWKEWAYKVENGEISEITTEPDQDFPNQMSIVLFGLSAPSEVDTDRTDCIMIVTIDHAHRQLKFTSILRDTKAEITGYRAQKINAANRLGGPELALKTINQNFDLNLSDYITVDFDQFMTIIDMLEGVDVNLTQEEADHLMRKHPSYSLKAGQNHLDGFMTLQYSRIRKIDSDVVRVSRQKNVLNDLVKKVSQLSRFNYLSFANAFRQMVTSTSLSLPDLLKMTAVPIWEYQVIENYIPNPSFETDVWGGIDENEEWVWIYDTHAAGTRIRDIIRHKQ